MANMHEKALQFYTKIKKGRFEEVLRRKLTAVESFFGDLGVEEQVGKLLDQNRMQWILFVSWVSARRSHSPYVPRHAHVMFATRYFEALGMSRQAVIDIRRRAVQYYRYDQHHDSIKAWAVVLYNRGESGKTDYHILKTYLVAFEHFRNQRPSLLSVREKRLQIRALRDALAIEPNSASPPLMGVSHYCEGCRNCGNDITEPGGIIQSDLDTITRLVQNHSTPSWTLQTLAYSFNSRDADVAGFDKIYYNPVKTSLFCRRRRGEPLSGAAAPIAPALDVNDTADPEQVVHEHREALFENLAVESGRLTTRSLINAFADFGSDGGTTNPEAVPIEETKPIPKPRKTGKASSKDRDLVTRRALGAVLLNCTEPNIEVDLVGVLWKANNSIHTRCVVCGRHCLAHSAHQTNDGMTCGKHINVECYPDYHRIWWVWNISRNEAERMLKPQSTLSLPCLICRTRIETKKLRTHDNRNKFFIVGLCSYHLANCSKLLPVHSRFKEVRIPPVRCDHLIAAALGYHKKMHL